MASWGKHLFFFCLLVTFSSIQARESMFFSKFTRHYSITKENGKKGPITILSVPIQAPTLAPAPSPASLLDVPEPAPAPVFGESEKGHGLFGEGSGMFPPKETSTTTTTYADENELLNEELDGVTSDQKYENSNYNNNGYTSTYNNNGYERSNYNNKNNNNGYKLGSARYETGNQNNNGYKLAGESYEAGNQNTENGYNNNGNTNNYNNNDYTNKYYNNGYKLAGESYEAGSQKSENGYSNTYNNNGYTTKYYNNGYKLPGESYEVGNQNSENGYTNTYDNNGNTNNYNNEGYTNKYYNNGYKLAGESHEAGNQNSENGYSNNGNTNNYNNEGYTNKYSNNGYKLAGESYEAGNQNSDNGYTRYETERQGMSDTRFMEGGKYYYNAKNENYYPANKYESGKVSTQNQGSYGNDENPNEFNTMEEYKSQEGYEESQEESLPWNTVIVVKFVVKGKVRIIEEEEGFWCIIEGKAKLWDQITNFSFHVWFSNLVFGFDNICLCFVTQKGWRIL